MKAYQRSNPVEVWIDHQVLKRVVLQTYWTLPLYKE
jgi:hypothetical protein